MERNMYKKVTIKQKVGKEYALFSFITFLIFEGIFAYYLFQLPESSKQREVMLLFLILTAAFLFSILFIFLPAQYDIMKQSTSGESLNSNFQMTRKTMEQTDSMEIEELKFKMLANQINPHFLMNTLEVIRMKAYLNSDQEVAQMIKSLGKMMRYQLQTSYQEVLLEAELQQVMDYMAIQNIRFNQKLHLQIENHIGNEYKILPLLIQPLVENSISHGYEDRSKEFFIEISFQYLDQDMIITVRDSGKGMEKKLLKKLQDNLASNASHMVDHIGLSNIHQRIQLFYGPKYGLTIQSVEGEYFESTLRLPSIK